MAWSNLSLLREAAFQSLMFFLQMMFSFFVEGSLNNLVAFINSYSEASGQLVNKSQSSYFLGKNSMHRKDIVASILGFNEGSLPFTYLGVPVFKGIPTRYFLQPIAVRKIGPLRKAELFGSLPVGLLTSLPPFSWWNITMPELQLCLRSSPALLGCITHPAPKVRSLLFVRNESHMLVENCSGIHW